MNLQPLLTEIADAMAREGERGRVATYIPELARVDPARFGIAAALPDGRILRAGDADVPFSIQSISKVFSLALTLDRVGEALWERVGREPSGDPFNSIVQLEAEAGIPRNPFINAGALAVTDALMTAEADPVGAVLASVRQAAGDGAIAVDAQVAASEAAHGDRNLALAHFMAAHDRLSNPAPDVCTAYFRHCAIAMSCAQLARAGLRLASPGSGMGSARRRRLLALMLTCGHYDASGDFAFRVGLPGKSGVGGGILAIAPGRASVAVWSPGLNANGNSHLGTMAMERLARATGWSVFG
ncbi:glutaminase [Jannaschia sp. Os4]|uniref:glutaminase n=1 Tax=Jannaschia sp. Os4 TaxID=2807617 RepID=UPI0019392AB4|nr:glutaminase [Jannaschia sp. Os4]MBM2576859.1 glutaminase [Jannaschia sp. Os4]